MTGYVTFVLPVASSGSTMSCGRRRESDNSNIDTCPPVGDCAPHHAQIGDIRRMAMRAREAVASVNILETGAFIGNRSNFKSYRLLRTHPTGWPSRACRA